MNKFEQVSSDDHQIAVLSRGGVGPMSGVQRERGGRPHVGGVCTVRSNVSWVMVTWDPLVNRQTPVKTLLSRNFVFVRQ